MKAGAIIVVDGNPYEALVHDQEGCGDCAFFDHPGGPCPTECWDASEDVELKFRLLPLAE